MPRKRLIVLFLVCALRGFAEDVNLPGSAGGHISGTVVDGNDAIVPGATVLLRCQSPCKEESTSAGDTGAFEFSNLSLGTPYEIGVSANGFKDWTSAPIVLTPEQKMFFLTDVRIETSEVTESVTVHASRAQIATEQVRLEEQQRILWPALRSRCCWWIERHPDRRCHSTLPAASGSSLLLPGHGHDLQPPQTCAI